MSEWLLLSSYLEKDRDAEPLLTMLFLQAVEAHCYL